MKNKELISYFYFKFDKDDDSWYEDGEEHKEIDMNEEDD